MTRHRKLALPLLAALAAALAISACGHTSEETEVVEGEPVELGELQYNAIFSRFLNPNDNEDSAYLVGQPPAPPDSGYFGVFFEVQNESEETAQTLAGSMAVHDADGRAYESLPSDSLYAMPFGGEVEPEEEIPVLDSTAQQGPIEGSVALFLIPDSALENRPLILEIPGPGGPAEITLDL